MEAPANDFPKHHAQLESIRGRLAEMAGAWALELCSSCDRSADWMTTVSILEVDYLHCGNASFQRLGGELSQTRKSRQEKRTLPQRHIVRRSTVVAWGVVIIVRSDDLAKTSSKKAQMIFSRESIATSPRRASTVKAEHSKASNTLTAHSEPYNQGAIHAKRVRF